MIVWYNLIMECHFCAAGTYSYKSGYTLKLTLLTLNK